MKIKGLIKNKLLKKRNILKVIFSLVLLICVIAFYNIYLSRTFIAFINYQPISLQAISKACDNPFIKLYAIDENDISNLDKYDIILINGMGLNIDSSKREEIMKLASHGKPIYTTMATNPENNISNFTMDEAAIVQQWLMSGGKKNYHSLLNFLRKNVDGKIIFTGSIFKAEQKLSDYLYYPLDEDEENEFVSVKEYEDFLKKSGLYIEGAPKIVISGQITDPTDLIEALFKEKRYNIYPIYSLTKMLDFVHEIKPEAIINLAHGRLGDDMVEYLKNSNCLLFDPLTINEEKEVWQKDDLGMLGGYMSQSIVMPEIDGAIRTQVLFAQRKDSQGMLYPYAIEDRLEDFVSCINKYMDLKVKPNGEKHIAIVYFKSPGQGSMIASGLDVIPSLYNTLKELKSQGYNVDGLPATVEDFAFDIKTKGLIFNSFALGDASSFLKTGKPEILGKEEYLAWTSKCLRKDKLEEVDKTYGEFPGKDNILKTGEDSLAFARIQYGNIVLLPQPMPSEGKDTFKIVHGSDEVPPHSYIAPYLWLRYKFGADALIHFGTHGSLEFTPKKQVALSNSDWPDRLVGDLPHFYLYSIDNVGEAMTAKRRSYAQLISYLTPPYKESGLRKQYSDLEKLTDEYFSSSSDKNSIASKIKTLIEKLGIDKDLSIEKDKPLSQEDVEKIEDFFLELASEKLSSETYVLGVPYKEENIKSSVYSMTIDPIAYAKFNLDRLKGKTPKGMMPKGKKFETTYISKASEIVKSLYNSSREITDDDICSLGGISKEELSSSRKIIEKRNAPRGMLAMMMALSRKDSTSTKKDSSSSMASMMQRLGETTMDVPKAKNGVISKFMRYQSRKMMASKDASSMLALAKKMGASDEALKKMEKAMGTMMGGSSQKNSSKEKEQDSLLASQRDVDMALAINELETAVKNVYKYKELLVQSPKKELESLINALNSGYTSPSPGGDVIANPNTLPTGRNLFAINTEETPSEQAWEKGVALAKETIENYQKTHNGEYPRKVSYTLWSGEFIQTSGATLAQVLYMLGVEPIRDRYGRVTDLSLIPEEELNRPRIDVVVQTSGQLRDLAASRLFLISKAVRMAENAPKGKFSNMVKEGVDSSERYLIDKGVSPKKARQMAEFRVFGGLQGGYGTGIQQMVEKGDSWTDEKEIAQTYLNNMGAYYGDEDLWEDFSQDVFAAALTNTDVVVQPRQSNSWGALSLDHVYEFMGGINLAVREVTGKDPEAYFSDYRNRNNFRLQSSKDAINVEARTKLLNPEFIKSSLSSGANSTDALAEMVRNTYGWNVMKPEAIDSGMWDEIFQVYVEDKNNLDLVEEMGRVNPTAFQELTATMMETARKGYWKPSKEQLQKVAQLHTDFVKKYGPSGDMFEGDNKKLQDYIADNLDKGAAKEYTSQIRKMQTQDEASNVKGMVMEKETVNKEDSSIISLNGVVVVVVVIVVFCLVVILVRKRRDKYQEE